MECRSKACMGIIIDKENIKKLIDSFGYSEIKASSEELSIVTGIPISNIKTFLKRAAHFELLEVTALSKNDGGYITPNVIKILKNNSKLDSIRISEDEYLWWNVQEYMTLLKEQTNNVFERINKRLSTNNDDFFDKIYEQFIYLQTKQNELFTLILKFLKKQDNDLKEIQAHKIVIKELNDMNAKLVSEKEILFQQNQDLIEKIQELNMQMMKQ